MQSVWYDEYSDRLIEASEFIDAVRIRMKNDESLKKFFEDYEKETLAQFIFESNSIEMEGLPEGQTKKLVLESLEGYQIPALFESVADLSLDAALKQKRPDDESVDNIQGVYKYKARTKDVTTVLNHFTAVLRMQIVVQDAIIYTLQEFSKIESHPDIVGSQTPRMWMYTSVLFRLNQLNKYIGVKRGLIEEAQIRKLHADLAASLANNNNGGPGEYRPLPAMIDMKTIFLEPALIQQTMTRVFQEHLERVNWFPGNSFLEAVRLSSDLVKIHPFGDFNGRLSRIILNGILRMDGMPFFLVLRSGSKGKKKYFTAMKRAFGGNNRAYLSLVCGTYIEQMVALNKRLAVAGIQEITKIEYTDAIKDSLRNLMNKYLASEWTYK